MIISAWSVTYSDAFQIWIEYDAALEAARKAKSPGERLRARQKAQKLKNQILPPSVQAAAPAHDIVVREATRWFREHGWGSYIADFIRHFQSLGCANRLNRKSGNWAPLSESAIRKILRERLGIKGRSGHPKGR